MISEELLGAMGTDPRKWAQEFVRRSADQGDSAYTEGSMVGWFASAMEAGREAAHQEVA